MRWCRTRIAVIAGLMALAAQPHVAWSHAADEMAPPPGAVVIAPRAETRAGQTEIVTIFSHQILAVFLSRYANDVPITGATVEASTDLQTAPLTETDPGVYSTKDLLMSSGRNDLTIKFTTDGVTAARSLSLMLPEEAPEAPAAKPAITTAGPMTIAGAILAVYVLLCAAFVVGRRRPPQVAAMGATTQARRA